MGGEGSGRHPSVETILKRNKPDETPVGNSIFIPNLSGIADSSRKDRDGDNLVVVIHGATAATARPTSAASSVIWIGSVEPTNAENNDMWVDTS